MRSQSLRHVVVVKQRTTVKMPSGAPRQEWTQVGPQRRASILHARGSAVIHSNADASQRADMQTATIKASIRLRYCTDILPGMRVHHGSVVYDVLAVLPDEVRRDHIDLVVETVNGKGIG